MRKQKRCSKSIPEHGVELLHLAEYELVFKDERNYFEYEGDTKYVTETIIEANSLVIRTPVFQTSIPSTLKNIFDLLPVKTFLKKRSVSSSLQKMRIIL